MDFPFANKKATLAVAVRVWLCGALAVMRGSEVEQAFRPFFLNYAAKVLDGGAGLQACGKAADESGFSC